VKVLIIEANQRTTDDITFCLQTRYPGVKVFSAGEAKRALEIAEGESPDLVIMDSSVPRMDVLGVITGLRQFSQVPVLMLSEAETDMDRARGLEAGADEYLAKPFNPMELLARCKALLRRAKTGLSERMVSINDLTVNFTTHEVYLSGGRIKLTPTEFALLTELVKNQGTIVTHRDLLQRVWGPQYVRDHDLVKAYIWRLRSKLETSGGPRIIMSERGLGYRLTRGA
jgi:DNA-binding response OmpR family regulator